MNVSAAHSKLLQGRGCLFCSLDHPQYQAQHLAHRTGSSVGLISVVRIHTVS